MAAKNITSPESIFDPCAQKKFFTTSTKKVVPNNTAHVCTGRFIESFYTL